MKENLLIAKEHLIDRWVTAFNEQAEFDNYTAQTLTVKYADILSYNLTDYKNGKITIGSKLLDSPPSGGLSYVKYGFNLYGFLTTIETYNRNELSHIGFLTKTTHLIEYIEFYCQSNAPSCVQRLFLKNGKKTMLQSVFSNGRSGLYFESNGTLKEKVTASFNDGYSAVCTIEQYEYAHDAISKAYSMAIMPGLGQYFYTNLYNYEGAKLASIKTVYEDDNRSVFKYVAPSRRSLKSITDELAGLLCDLLIQVLQEQQFDSPLFSVELCYRYCDNYLPNPVIITERQKDEAIADGKDNLFIDGEFIYTTNIPNDVDKLYTEFYNRMERKDKWEAGKKMLIATAKLLTASRLKGVIPVTKDFIAFPIEWELEFETFRKILLRCGASKKSVKQWDKYGWL